MKLKSASWLAYCPLLDDGACVSVAEWALGVTLVCGRALHVICTEAYNFREGLSINGYQLDRRTAVISITDHIAAARSAIV